MSKKVENKIPSFFYDNSEGDENEIFIDYFISWTLRCAVHNNGLSSVLKDYSKKVLLKILSKTESVNKVPFDDIVIKEVMTYRQWERIDLHAEIILEINGKLKKFVVVFENKLYTKIHDNQLKKYKDSINNFYDKSENKKTDYERVFVFLTCNPEVPDSDQKECDTNGYKAFTVQEIRDSFNGDETGNYLFDEFWFRYFHYNA